MKALVHKLAFLFRKLLEGIVLVCLLVVAGSVFVQVCVRELFSFSILPLDDVIPYAFSVCTFAGTALLFKDGGHIAITVLTDVMPAKFRRLAIAFSHATVLFFLMFLLIVGVEFWWDGRFQYSPLLRFQLIWVYTIVPLSAIASLIFVLDNLLSRVPPPADGGAPAETL